MVDAITSVMDPVRRKILEVLGNEGKSISQIADVLDVNDGRILFHIRRLANEGLVDLNDKEKDAREWFCKSLVTCSSLGEPGERQEIIHQPIDDFNQASHEFRDGLFGVASIRLLGIECRSRLSEEQAYEFRRRLQELAGEYFLPARGDQTGIKYGFLGIFEPIDVHPLGESIQGTAEIQESHLDQLFDAIFQEEVDVHPAYVTAEESLRSFRGATELAEFAKSQLSYGTRLLHVVVRYIAGGPPAELVPISPDSYGSPGDSMKFSFEGWGLVHVQLKSFDNRDGIYARIAANTQERAFGQYKDIFSYSGDPNSWDWKVVETRTHHMVQVLEEIGKPIQPRSNMPL